MRTRLSILLALCIFSLLSFKFASDEDDPLKALLQKIERYRDSYVSEKVHIHTDKPYYSIGDTIWFKSYVVLGGKNQLSNLSKFVYVELINDRDSIKSSVKLALNSGLASGDFTLSDSLSEGNYRIRAYTTWMRNFEEAYFFDKTIRVGNVLSNKVVSNVSYKFSKTGVKEHVDATISYKTLDGKPLAGKEVKYEVILDHRNIMKAAGKTDADGILKLKFTNAQPFILKSGKINTFLKVDSLQTVRKVFPVKATSDNVDVQFFPESGNLVNHISSVVAFKALGSDGLGKNISGYLTDDSGARLIDFSSEYAGMGRFQFLPDASRMYTAVVRFDDGSEKKFELPKVRKSGYVLSALSNANNVHLRVAVAGELNPADEMILIGQSHGIVSFISRNKLDRNVFSAVVPKSRFPVGLVHFTLFNSQYQPLAERLVFINQSKTLNISFKTEETYSPRQLVKMDLNITDSTGRPAVGAFSLSVTNESQVPVDETKEVTILSNLLLSADLKGYIENPNYYFFESTPQKERQLDNLMLSQGWTRFEWKDIVSGIFPTLVYKPERDLTISGKVYNTNGTAAAGGRVTIMSSRGTGVIIDTLIGASGEFRFDNLTFNDSTTFIIQARSAKGKKNVGIELDHIPPQMVTKNPNATGVELNVNQSMLPYLALRDEQFDLMRKNGMLRKAIVLKEVKIAEVKPKVKHSSNLNGAGNADNVITASQLSNCQNLIVCLQSRVPGLIIQNGIAYLMRNMSSSFYGPVPMQLVVDGMYLEPTFLSSINPQDVESIEVLKSIGNTAIYGIRGGGGLLLINTKRGERNMSARSYAPGITSFKPQGVYLGRQFYSPKYSSPAKSGVPDLRTTILWEPNIVTSNGRASVEFFSSDKPGTYKAVIEGVDINGSLVRKVHRFKVK